MLELEAQLAEIGGRIEAHVKKWVAENKPLILGMTMYMVILPSWSIQ